MSMYVISGVTGHVGSVVARELLAQGAKVRAIVRDSRQGEAWTDRGAEVAVGSLESAAFLTHALEGASGLFTLLPEDPAVPDFHAHRRRIADAIAAAVKQSRVPHVVMQSAIAAHLPDRNGPVKDLHYLENALGATGVKLTANRAAFFQENIASVIPAARQAGIYPNLMPSADAAFPMISTMDVGRFAAQALATSPPTSEVVDLLGPTYSVRQLAAKLGAALGKDLQIVDIPPAGQVAALMQAGLPRAFAEAVAELHAAFAAGLIAPKGDRTLIGKTTIDEVLTQLISMEPQVSAAEPGTRA